MPPKTRLSLAVSATSLLLFQGHAGTAFGDTGAEIFEYSCTGCHETGEDGAIARIDAVRKTPEAWDMTVVRMMRNHGLALEPEERRGVVDYLAGSRGLSVVETEGWRYILEKQPVATDTGPDQLMTETCGRCHSYARVALQRRTPEDWKHLINFHLGQFPSLEYQALARDRDWWGIANTDILAYLSEAYPLGEAPEAFTGDLGGRYVVAGHQPGRGAYSGTMQLAAAEAGYDVDLTLSFADGSENYTGTGKLYGAGEWRATLTAGDTTLRQVMALDGTGRLGGRWFHATEDVTGGRITALPETAAPQVIGRTVTALPLGRETEITLTGTGLGGAVTWPEGLAGRVVSQTGTQLTLALTAATEGPHSLELEGLAAPVDLLAYESLDRITIVPEVAISRVGGNGGPIPKVPAQFEAMGWSNGPDGQPGTEDDLALGVVQASWSFDNWDEAAAAIGDAKYAGAIDQTGRFTPADAGPNPERVMSTNNTGNLKVIATYEGANGPLTAEAHLYATVQRFVDAPIR